MNDLLNTVYDFALETLSMGSAVIYGFRYGRVVEIAQLDGLGRKLGGQSGNKFQIQVRAQRDMNRDEAS